MGGASSSMSSGFVVKCIPCAVFAGNADLLRALRHFGKSTLLTMPVVMLVMSLVRFVEFVGHGGRGSLAAWRTSRVGAPQPFILRVAAIAT